MAEQLYTIPVNDAFHADCECPLCQMQKTLEEHAIEYTMGPSYMKDRIDIAVKGTIHTVTDKAGAFQFFDICTDTGKI